jgi:hypothetical protein
MQVPIFYITSRQPLRPGTILLAIIAAAAALSLVLYGLSHNGRPRFGSGTDRSANANSSEDKEDDDPNQVDTIVLGDPGDAPMPARPGEHVSPVHPTIIVHLPRWGEQVGFIPNSPAGQLLYNWLAAFNQASYSGLANTLPTISLGPATAAQMELRRRTGGFSLLSAKEVLPGVLVFRLHDQTPNAIEVLGALQVRQNTKPAEIESFSLREVPAPQPAHAVDKRN